MKNYQSKDGLVHRGVPGLENAEALEGLIEAGWTTQVSTVCHSAMMINAMVAEPVTCLLCMANAKED